MRIGDGDVVQVVTDDRVGPTVEFAAESSELNLALAQGAKAIVIAGGLGLRLKDKLLESGFGQRFTSKGRFQTLMAGIPVKLITHPQPGLFGAAAAFAQEHAR